MVVKTSKDQRVPAELCVQVGRARAHRMPATFKCKTNELAIFSACDFWHMSTEFQM